MVGKDSFALTRLETRGRYSEGRFLWALFPVSARVVVRKMDEPGVFSTNLKVI